MTQYRFFIEPMGEGANEEIARLLNLRADAAEFLVQLRLKVSNRDDPIMAYEVPEHYILTLLKRSGQYRKFRAYVQEGVGIVRPYHHFNARKRSLYGTPSVREAQEQLDELKKRK